ncbi:MAG: FkbM family methyltransferase [Halioglobus sp.]|jgi:FkbM family methyltransferase
MSSEPIALQLPGSDFSLRLYVHGEQDQFVSRRIRQEGVWEPYESSLVLSLLQPGDVFVDVGANIGYFCVLAAAIVGEAGAVFAFEPDSDNCDLLRRSAALNDMDSIITVVEAGLSDTSGEAQLFLSENNLGDHQIYATDDARPSTPISLYHGSDYLRGRLQRIDLLKVDTQGSEYQVMAGLLPLLQELARVPRMIIELTPYSLRQAGASGRALIELLATLGEPLSIIDHIEHRVVLSSTEDLALWCDNVDRTEGDQGFMNILVGSTPSGL